MTDAIETEIVRRTDQPDRRTIETDICVLGAGISGLSAALEAAEAGADVTLVDATDSIGGQAVWSKIGTIIGLYSHGREPRQLTHGVADDFIGDLEPAGAIVRRRSSEEIFGTDRATVVFNYDQVALGRWFERRVADAGITTIVNGLMTDATIDDGRVRHIDVAHRFGSVRVEADGYVDASGDASLTWAAGLECREPTAPIYGTMKFLIEGYDTAAMASLDMSEVNERLEAVGGDYDLLRDSGHMHDLPEKDFLTANVTHMETPLDPLESANMVFEGREKADNALAFFKAEFPDVFSGASVRSYANPGIRMTRWIVGRRQLTLDDLESGARPPDAVGRAAWWVELHDVPEGISWVDFPNDHVYYIPLSCMIPAEADNIVATGRCVDADVNALAAIRVMGPGIAMGAAAAHALDLSGPGPVHDVDMDALQERLSDNLGA